MTTSRESLPAYATTQEQAARIRARITALVASWGPMPTAKVLRSVQLLRPHFNPEEPAPRRKAS